MRVCEDGHEEIVYTERACPLCEALSTIEDLEIRIEDLEEKIERIEV